MPSATITTKGQITIPADVRRTLRVASGDRIEFVEVGPGRFEILAATGTVRDLKGILGARARTVSLEEIDAAIVSAATDSE